MFRYLLVSLGSGLLFGVLDALLNANPLAVRLFAVYKPIARSSVNPLAGMAIDIAYGFIMAGIFLVVMQAASTWIMFEVPLQTIGYSLAAGLLEMVLIGLLYGLSLKPFSLQ
jgi:uncharacterized membrane protein YraQ (UPF0718 family)